jgi:hypothetical protein
MTTTRRFERALSASAPGDKHQRDMILGFFLSASAFLGGGGANAWPRVLQMRWPRTPRSRRPIQHQS